MVCFALGLAISELNMYEVSKSMHEFLGLNLVRQYFQRRCRLKLLLPYGPMLAKTKNICKKFKISSFKIL